MNSTQSPISKPASHHLSSSTVALALAVMGLGVVTVGHDASVPLQQQPVRFEVVGYGNNV